MHKRHMPFVSSLVCATVLLTAQPAAQAGWDNGLAAAIFDVELYPNPTVATPAGNGQAIPSWNYSGPAGWQPPTDGCGRAVSVYGQCYNYTNPTPLSFTGNAGYYLKPVQGDFTYVFTFTWTREQGDPPGPPDPLVVWMRENRGTTCQTSCEGSMGQTAEADAAAASPALSVQSKSPGGPGTQDLSDTECSDEVVSAKSPTGSGDTYTATFYFPMQQSQAIAYVSTTRPFAHARARAWCAGTANR